MMQGNQEGVPVGGMIVGHARNLAYLHRVLQKGVPAHAYLFHGPERVGKKTVALAFARSLLCREGNVAPFGGCGSCDECRLVDSLTHPDLILLSLERPLLADEAKREIGVKNTHELMRFLAGTPWRGGRKVAVIDGAEDLSRDAQASLLKTLEEPMPRTVFLLVTSAPGAIADTIRSRSVPLGFGFVSDAELAPLLEIVPIRHRDEFLELALGRPGVLAAASQDPASCEALRRDAERFAGLLRAGLPEQFAFSDRESREPGRVEAFLLFLLSRLRRDLHAALAKGGFPFRVAGLLGTILSRLSLLEATAVNRRLVADSIFFEMTLARATRP